MNRRDLLALIGGAAAFAPFGAAGQPGLPVIGYLSPRSAEAETSRRIGFLEGLEQRGFVVGQNVAIEYRFSDGSVDRLPSLAAELIGLSAALLVATGAPAAIVAKKVTAALPIVFSSGNDPVAAGLVESLARPGGNATGTHSFGVDVIPKRLELLREILPQPGLIAFLVGPQTPSTPEQIRRVEAAAQAVAQPILVLHGRNDDEIDNAFATMAERQVRGLLYAGSEYFQVIADKLISLAARNRIPACNERREFVTAGG
jgi:putative ABC transport system substrate-binding protein